MEIHLYLSIADCRAPQSVEFPQLATVCSDPECSSTRSAPKAVNCLEIPGTNLSVFSEPSSAENFLYQSCCAAVMYGYMQLQNLLIGILL